MHCTVLFLIQECFSTATKKLQKCHPANLVDVLVRKSIDSVAEDDAIEGHVGGIRRRRRHQVRETVRMDQVERLQASGPDDRGHGEGRRKAEKHDG